MLLVLLMMQVVVAALRVLVADAPSHLDVDGVAPPRVADVGVDAGGPREDPPGGVVDEADPAGMERGVRSLIRQGRRQAAGRGGVKGGVRRDALKDELCGWCSGTGFEQGG